MGKKHYICTFWILIYKELMRNFQKLILTILLSVIGGVGLLAQNSVKVSGVVTSADDGLPMIGVAVMAGSLPSCTDTL